MLAERIATIASSYALGPAANEDIRSYLRGLYYDAAMATSQHTLAELLNIVDPSHILYGSDTPWLPEEPLEAFNRHLAQPHSLKFRFSVQGNSDLCCIGSPIDDRQYGLVLSFNTPWTSNGLPSTVGASGALFVVTYADFLQEVMEADPDKAAQELVQSGADTSRANGKRLLNYTVLQQLDRPNRFAILEVWDAQGSYTAWQGSATTAAFISQVTPLLGSPFDHRLNILCGKTFVDGTGGVPP